MTTIAIAGKGGTGKTTIINSILKIFQALGVKIMLAAWEREYPGRTESIFRSICNVAPSQLGDTALFDFASLRVDPAVRGGAAVEADTGLYLPAIAVVNL